MGSACCLPRRRIGTGGNSESSKTPDACEKENGTKEENSTPGTKRRGLGPQQDPRHVKELCTYESSPKTPVRKMKHTDTGTEKSVTVELLQMPSRNATSNSETVLREECHSDVETGRGTSYRDDGTTLIHGKDLEDDSTEPTVRGDSTSSLTHLSLTKLSDGAQGKVVLSSSIDPERTLNREGLGVSNKDDSTTLNHSKETENQNTEPASDLREDVSCSSVPHLPSSDSSDGAQGAAAQRTSHDGELEDKLNQKEVQPTSTDEMLNCVEPPLQGTSGDGTVVEQAPLSVNMTNEGIEDICQQSKDSSNSIDEEESLEFQDCEQEFPGSPLKGKMPLDSQGKDEDSKDTSEDKDNQLKSQNTKDSVPDISHLPPEGTLDDGNSHVHGKSSSGDANVDQQIIVQETTIKDNERNDPESSNHPTVLAVSESTLRPPTCQYTGCTRRCAQSKKGTYYDYCCLDHKRKHRGLHRKSANEKGRKPSNKSEESDNELHPTTSEGSVAGRGSQGNEHQPINSNLLDTLHHQQTNAQTPLQEKSDKKQKEVQTSLQENLEGKQRDVQALLLDNKQLYNQPATQESLNNAHPCPDVQTHQTTGDRKEYNHQNLPETSNSVDKGAEVKTAVGTTKTKRGPQSGQPRKTKSKRSQRPVHFYHKHEPYYEFTNFYQARIWVDGKIWATTENYFQAQKYIGTPLYGSIQECGTAREAFTISRSPQGSRWRRSDWEEVKQDVMYVALYAKFTQHGELKKSLLGTGDRLLVEHTERDRYWGDGGDGRGENHLGKLLMKLRGELNV